MHPELLETLRSAQRFGFFGGRPVEQAAEHSLDFVDAIDDLVAPARLLDLGSGGGLPGLVVADARPDLDVVLLDRRQKRTDFLERAVTRLGLVRATVMCADVSVLIGAVRSSSVAGFDVVMARGFGPPEFTLRCAVAVLAAHGRILISEPPEGDRWPVDLLAELGVSGRRRGSVRVFRRVVDEP
jgi:16S rRNA (guanine527-N7)-methyltransferase